MRVIFGIDDERRWETTARLLARMGDDLPNLPPLHTQSAAALSGFSVASNHYLRCFNR